MSGEMIIRDPDEMEKFAGQLEDYCMEMRTVCTGLKNCLSNCAPGMKDRVSKKALERTEWLADDLLAGLPALEECAETLRKAAGPLKQARTLL